MLIVQKCSNSVLNNYHTGFPVIPVVLYVRVYKGPVETDSSYGIVSWEFIYALYRDVPQVV
jgi:hypothetical protein